MRGEEEEVAEKTRGGLCWESGPVCWVGGCAEGHGCSLPGAGSLQQLLEGGPVLRGPLLLGALSYGDPRGAAVVPL